MKTSKFKLFLLPPRSKGIPTREEFEKIANHPTVIACTNRLMEVLPCDAEFESFAEMKKRRNKYGIVPMKPPQSNQGD